jgi:hypothetical protein
MRRTRCGRLVRDTGHVRNRAKYTNSRIGGPRRAFPPGNTRSPTVPIASSVVPTKEGIASSHPQDQLTDLPH